MTIAVRFAARTDVGLVRSRNEDSGYAGPHLLAVADGMGGHAGGNVASSLVLARLAPLDGDSHGSDDALELLADTIADAELRDDRAPEILMQTQNTLAFFATLLPLSAARTPATLQLLGIANQLALFAEMQMKHIFACARPVEYSPQVQPMITTPGHGSYPMGHGCEAQVTARLLAELTRPDTGTNTGWNSLENQLERLADRIAENRIIAGVHFKIDQLAGKVLGDALAACLIACGQEGTVASMRKTVFEPQDTGPALQSQSETSITLPAPEERREIRQIWQHARREWRWLTNDVTQNP